MLLKLSSSVEQVRHLWKMSEKFDIYCKIFFRDVGTFFDTCVNWSCVTRCGCRTTSLTLFTVYWPPTPSPPLGAGGGHTRWVERGGGVNILEDARHCSALSICKYFVIIPSRESLVSDFPGWGREKSITFFYSVHIFETSKTSKQSYSSMLCSTTRRSWIQRAR